MDWIWLTGTLYVIWELRFKVRADATHPQTPEDLDSCVVFVTKGVVLLRHDRKMKIHRIITAAIVGLSLIAGVGPTANAAKTKKPAKTKAKPTAKKSSKVAPTTKRPPLGSRSNPFPLNTTVEHKVYYDDSYRLVIKGTKKLTVADIKPGIPGKFAIAEGMEPLLILSELTYLGPANSADLAATGTLELVNDAGRAFGTYSGDTDEGGECSQFGDYPGSGMRNMVPGVPLIDALCVVLPTSSMNSSLLITLRGLSETGIWFKTAP
jgi:hypothetical protein